MSSTHAFFMVLFDPSRVCNNCESLWVLNLQAP